MKNKLIKVCLSFQSNLFYLEGNYNDIKAQYEATKIDIRETSKLVYLTKSSLRDSLQIFTSCFPFAQGEPREEGGCSLLMFYQLTVQKERLIYINLDKF
jgi:hypothetical protein